MSGVTGHAAPRSALVDRLGAFASGACAAHCAICALVPGVLAALGLSTLVGHEAEWGFTLTAVCFAAGALFLGWRRHQDRTVLVLLGMGVAGLIASRFLEDFGGDIVGTATGIFAGGALVVGHILNIRASRRTESCCT